jgi:hypothetical protein
MEVTSPTINEFLHRARPPVAFIATRRGKWGEHRGCDSPICKATTGVSHGEVWSGGHPCLRWQIAAPPCAGLLPDIQGDFRVTPRSVLAPNRGQAVRSPRINGGGMADIWHTDPRRRTSTVSTSASTRLLHASNRHGTGRPRATHHNDHPDPFPDPNGGAPRPRPWRQCFHLTQLHQWLRERRFLYAQEPRPSYRLRWSLPEDPALGATELSCENLGPSQDLRHKPHGDHVRVCFLEMKILTARTSNTVESVQGNSGWLV